MVDSASSNGFERRYFSGASIVEVETDRLLDYRGYQGAFDEKGLKDLVESIERDGLAQLPLARPLEGGCYELLSGHRRRDCYKILNRKYPGEYAKIQIAVREDVDDDLASMLFYVTNLTVRVMSQAERAQAYVELAKLVPELRSKDETLKGVRTHDIVARILQRETGQVISGRTISRVIASSRYAQEVRALSYEYEKDLIREWSGEFRDSLGFQPKVVKEIAGRSKKEQAALWTSYQESQLTSSEFNKRLLRRRSLEPRRSDDLLERMIVSAQELNALHFAKGYAVDGEKLDYLIDLLRRIDESGKVLPLAE